MKEIHGPIFIINTRKNIREDEDMKTFLREKNVMFQEMYIQDYPSLFSLLTELTNGEHFTLPQFFDKEDQYLGDKASFFSNWSEYRILNAEEEEEEEEEKKKEEAKGKEGRIYHLYMTASTSSASSASSSSHVGGPNTPGIQDEEEEGGGQDSYHSMSSQSISFETGPVPTYKNKSEEQEFSRTYLSQIAQRLLFGKRKLSVRMRWYAGGFHKKTFSIRRLKRELSRFVSRAFVSRVAWALYQEGYIVPLDPRNFVDFESTPQPFRFVYHTHRLVLNYLYEFQPLSSSSSSSSSSTSTSIEMRSANTIVREINELFLSLCDKYVSPDGKGVDYSAIAVSPEFHSYVDRVHELQVIRLDDLSEKALKTFFLNLYNALIIHANIAIGPPTSIFQRSTFFTSVSYWINGIQWSLDDIEHGVLRNNGPLPGIFSRSQFGSSDPKRRYCLPPDPRIHFALVCGAKSCPPLRTFHEESLDEELDIVSRCFCNSEIDIDFDAKEITLSLLFKWYKADFGSTDAQVLEWISRFLIHEIRVQDFSVKYSTYDWTPNRLFSETHSNLTTHYEEE